MHVKSCKKSCSGKWKIADSLYVYMYVCVYIYIYIVIHRQIFVVSRLFSVVRHVGCLKLRLKPTQLYVKLSIILLSYLLTYISSVIIRHFVVALVCLHFALLDTRVLNSYEELCITQVAAINSFARELNPWWESVYIVIHRQTVSLYHNSSVWLDM